MLAGRPILPILFIASKLQKEMDFGTPFLNCHRVVLCLLYAHGVSLTFFYSLRQHVRPTLKKNNSGDSVAATADIPAFMPVQAGQNLHESNSHLTGDKTGILQIVPPRTVICMQDMFVFALDYTVSHFSCYK